MKRAWTAVAILLLSSGSFALEIKIFERGGPATFRKPLPRITPYIVVEGLAQNFLKQVGLSVFSPPQTPSYDLLVDHHRNDFTSFSRGGVQLDVVRRLAVFMEVSHFRGLANLARAGLAHGDSSNLRGHPLGLQAGFRYQFSAN
jgi:hypothetical protein